MAHIDHGMFAMVKIVRLLAMIEGISLITLLFVAMPLKYHYALPVAVTVVGWVHGMLWIVFLFYVSRASQALNWNDRFLFQLVLSSVIPFGMIFMDRRLKQKSGLV